MTVSLEVNASNVAANAAGFQPTSSFSQKLLSFTFQLAANSSNPQAATFAGQGGSNQVTLNGHRARVTVNSAATPSGATAEIEIFGISPSIINQLVTLGIVGDAISQNTVIISAGSNNSQQATSQSATILPPGGLSVIFSGTIWFAYLDTKSMPEVRLVLSAVSGLFNQLQPVAPASFKGSSSIVSIMQGFAKALGLPLENNGVSGSLTNPYFRGTITEQIASAAAHAGIMAQIVDGGTKLAIWNPGQGRTSQTSIPLISKTTGMITSPVFSPGYMVVESIFNPNVLFNGKIQVQSDNVPQASKTWIVFQITYMLDSLVPDGNWKMAIMCQTATVPQQQPSTPGASS